MDAFSAADAADEVLEQGETRLAFHGNGAEYFKIWIVNLALSVLTLGVFSAWAKVRAQRYFHANTELDGSRFEYHGQAKAILIGRGISVLLLLALILLAQAGSAMLFGVLGAGILIMPWLIASSMRFRSRMVSWRGVRFGWSGGNGLVYGQMALALFITVITFGIGYFAAHHRLKRMFVNKLRFGDQSFSAHSTSGEFFGPYFGFGILIGIVSKVPDIFGNPKHPGTLDIVLSVLTLAGLFVVYKVLGNVLNQRVHNKIHLAHLRFRNSVDTAELFGLYARIAVLTILTLGLYWPWARIEEMKYRLEHLQVLGNLPLLEAAAVQGDNSAAIGQEAAALFDFDVSF